MKINEPEDRTMKSKVPLYLLSLIAYLGMPLGVIWMNRIYEERHVFVLGMPLLLFWMVMWILLGVGIMLLVHRLNPDNLEEEKEATE
ncbi:DUF3311 domain-containing protein [Paenibacillus sp. Y412MC10]|uniref:DUF3311 domain-containing protein n=1 Tax=Geobacillus sp. (strain Y412MC10) TaxID=481743 RepID=UPI0011A043BF|nr:DUF3311 domain-containing protein [Paenibacillus sp. Y412MC10]